MYVVCNECLKGVNISVTPQQVRRWKSGALIQDAMPDVSTAHRELFITGYCETCFDKLFRNKY